MRRQPIAWFRLVPIVALLAGCVAVPQRADACGCEPSTPCRVFWLADAVFVGRVVSTGVEEIAERLDIAVATIEVEESLRGGLSGRVTIGSASRPTPGDSRPPPGQRWQSMTSCDYRFSEGQRYLVYARRMPDGRWTASDCSGTKPVDEAIEDLAFIQSVPGLPPGGRIYGDAQRVRRTATGTSEPEVTPLAGLRATFTNDRAQYEIVSGADGRFEIVVPPGTYNARPDIPETLKAYYPRTLTVADRGCAPMFFHVVSNGRIAGVARTPAGGPIAGAMVHLLPVEAVTGEQVRAVSLNSATTDPRGRFEIDSLPAGRYVLGINVRFGPRLESPYYAFHPAAGDRAGAAAIEVREGQLTAGVEIAADRLPAGRIVGVVHDHTSRPVPGARILAGPVVSNHSYSASTVSDDAGRFTLKVVGATTYVVRASVGTGPSFRESLATVRVDDRAAECEIVLGDMKPP